MTTERFPSKAGLAIAAIYVIAGSVVMYAPTVAAVVAGAPVATAISGALALAFASALTVVAIGLWRNRR